VPNLADSNRTQAQVRFPEGRNFSHCNHKSHSLKLIWYMDIWQVCGY